MNNSNTKYIQASPIALIVLLICGAPIFYCCGIPAITGQLCPDFMSGHVPPDAITIFLDRLFEATTAEDYDWLNTIANEIALKQLQEVQPVVTQNYTVIWGDDLAGLI